MKIGDIVSVPLYIGVSQHRPVFKKARIVAAYPKGHLGVMYLCKTLRSNYRTCIVEPPPPKYQPDAAYDRNTLQRWSKDTHHNALEVEPTPSTSSSTSSSTYQKRTHERARSIIDKYTPMLKELGLDPAVKRSITKLRSIAQFRGYDIDEIECE